MYLFRPPFPLAVAKIPRPRFAARRGGRTCKQFLPFGRMLQNERFHGVESIGRIAKAACRKRRLDFTQERIALSITCKLNRHASLGVRRSYRRRAKFAHAQSAQPGQRCPSQLIDHGWLLLRGRKTKKTARPTAVTTNKPIESTSKKVRQPSAPEDSPRRA